MAIGLTIGVLLIFLLGYYAGKLIAIELIFMFQLTFFSLLTIQDLSPTFFELSKLTYSRGYSFKVMETEMDIHRHFYPAGFLLEFINNYNLMSVLILLPPLIALILLLVNCCKYKNGSLELSKYEALLIGEITLYGLLFCFYTLGISVGISFMYGPYGL